MKTICVGSTNPIKIEAVVRGFRRMFPSETFLAKGCSVASGVSEQPMSDEETRRGAAQRAANARVEDGDADYWAGVEGGCEPKFGELLVFAWIVVLSKEQTAVGAGRTGAFSLPQEVAVLVQQGVELGTADDQVFGRSNSKQTNGAVGLLTGDVLGRCSYYETAVILALIPFRNPGLKWL